MGVKVLSYPGLLASLGTLLRDEPPLRAACVTGFFMFAAFSALWGSLVALVARPPYGFGSDTVGAFGFLGIAGLLASPGIGKATDRFSPRLTLIVGALALMAAFVLVAEAAHYFILLDTFDAVDRATASALTTEGVRQAPPHPSTPRVPDKRTDPRLVKEWWDSLSPEERQWLADDEPGRIGNLKIGRAHV